MTGFILSAPASGSGKTTITLGLLRAFARSGRSVRAAKSGPDYIDPRFHQAACGKPCCNLDAWAMTDDRIKALAAGHGTLLIEGAMGLFDGAPPDSKGATADLARILGLSVILIVDAARMAGSVAPLVQGFATFDPNIQIAGVILNNTGSDRHEAMLRRALAPTGLRCFGALRRTLGLGHPSRHLGLVQAEERGDLEAFLEQAADLVEDALDLDAIWDVGQDQNLPKGVAASLKPPAQSIAVARDRAFAFAYPHILSDWKAAGASIQFFSPLQDDAVPAADLVYLPGGYPELHAGQLAAAETFQSSLRKAVQSSDIYGECGGYMVLGDTLTDADGNTHRMAGLLGLETSFFKRKLHLGYRDVTASQGPFTGNWKAHEFHYATTVKAEGTPLFVARDAEGTELAPMGLIRGRASGSFAHLIDIAAPTRTRDTLPK